ncbi:MAG: tetratricopeptide repeat protein [Myxococcales bacterium]|nr:tetratricopeptide repeat protein [Myxococcales bacterium]
MHSRVDMTAAGKLRIPLVALLAGALGLVGCAVTAPGLLAGGGVAPNDVIRPDAPPEYDVIVAQIARSEGRLADATAAYERAVAKDEESAYLHRKVAESLAMTNRLEDSLHHAYRAFELDPDDQPTRLFLGQIYRLRRDPDAAEKVLLDDSGEPIDPMAASLLYQIYLGSERPAEALETAEWWVEQAPESLRARVALANAYQALGRVDDAERALRDALERDPGNLRIYDALARSLGKRGDRAAQISLYEEVLDRYPRHQATLIALGEVYLAENDLASAIAVFEKIEQYYPDDMHSVLRLGFLKYEDRKFDEAALRFERVLEVSPKEDEIAFFLGIVRRRSGDDDGAVEAFARISSDHQRYVDARRQIAAIREGRDDYAGALAEIENVIAVEPSRELDLYKASLLAKSGDFDGAIDHLEAMLDGGSGDDEVYYNLGVVYGEAKRIDEAVQYMQRALEANPDNASALNYVGYTWAERGVNLDEAETMILRAIELRPDDGYIVDSLGWVYYMRARPLVASGRNREARAYIERALEELKRAEHLTGGDPVVSEHLGDTYLLLDEKGLALERFEEASQMKPREEEQPNLFEKLESLQRELR